MAASAAVHAFDRSAICVELHVDKTLCSSDAANAPPLALDVMRCLVQQMPEYPKRANVFCVSTNRGEAYLMQVIIALTHRIV